MHDLILVEWKIVEHCVSMHVAGWTNSRSFLSSQTKRRCSSLGRVHCISSAVGLWSYRRRLLRLSTKKSNSSFFPAHYLIATECGSISQNQLSQSDSHPALFNASVAHAEQQQRRETGSRSGSRAVDGVSIIKKFPRRADDEMRSDRRQIARGCTQPASDDDTQKMRVKTHARTHTRQ